MAGITKFAPKSFRHLDPQTFDLNTNIQFYLLLLPTSYNIKMICIESYLSVIQLTRKKTLQFLDKILDFVS